jgi:hypothetical protein
MERLKTNTRLPAQVAIRRGARILISLETDGADFVCVDDTHAYIWHREQLVNLYDHQDLIKFLTKHGYVKPHTENRMIIAAWIIFAGLQRCA